MFCNLLINAYEALDGRGRVDISARLASTADDGALLPDGHAAVPTVVVDVADNGPGMPPELADKIFNPFFTTKPQGSGLGLAIVRKIVDAHEGRIDVTTADGRGTRFRVTLPVEPHKQATGRQAQDQGQDSDMARILVADDHDALRRGLALALAAAGHEVEEAGNGNAAIEKLHEGYFDVVVSDLKMGGSDGLDVLRTTKTLHPTTSVILMTAFGSVNTAVEAMKHGAFDYVQKPFEIEEMEVKVEKALELKRLRNELDYLRHEQQETYDFDKHRRRQRIAAAACSASSARSPRATRRC